MIERIEAQAEVSAEVIHRLEAGEALDSVGRSMSLGSADLIAAVACHGLGGDGSEGPSLVQAGPAHPLLVSSLSDASIAGLFPSASRPSRLALAAGLFQILGHWGASHTAAQEADDQGERVAAAYWHLIAHRREPDSGNAQYWARRVGRHPILGPLGESARPLLEANGDPKLTERLIGSDGFRPSGLIDLADRARAGSTVASLARKLQRLEMIHLLQASVEAVG